MSTNLPENPGCILEPVPNGLVSIATLIGAVELPENYVVPSWRDCFEEFEATDASGIRKIGLRPIPAKIRPRILNQGVLDTCVGHATSVQKSAQEGVQISPRDIWNQGKRKDGYPLLSFGTTLSACQDALVDPGAAEDSLVPRDPGMGRDAYLSLIYVTPEVEASRAKHKAKYPYYVPRTMMKATIVAYGFPLVTSSAWYPSDNAVGPTGILHLPSENQSVGHSYGHIATFNVLVENHWKQAHVMVNSFGPDWGDNGLFYVPLDGTENRLGNAYVSVDVEPSLAQLLAQYNGRNVKSGVEHWKIENGQRRKYPNEDVWWLNGNLFGYEVYDINAADLEMIPIGPDMNIDAVSFKEKERYRQMRQHLGKA